MDKETFIKTYIDIETKTFVRADRTRRLNDFIADLKRNHFDLLPSELIECIHYLQREKIAIRQPLFIEIFYPILTAEIDKDNVDAIKTLLGLFDYYGNYQNLTSDKKFSVWQLLEQGIRLRPNDDELLRQYEAKQRDYFEYSLHEIPSGVLYGMNGATIEQCDELLTELTKYEAVCVKLKLDKHELIGECKFYYSAYKDYLTSYKSYNGFADYLDKNKSDK